MHRVAICRVYIALNSIEISHQFTKTFEQIKTRIFLYDIRKSNDLSLREIKSLSLETLEEVFDADTEVIE